MRSTPFSRSISMFAAIAGIMSCMQGVAAQNAIRELGPYESRGKGGKKPHRSVGTKAFQRAAAKRKARHV